MQKLNLVLVATAATMFFSVSAEAQDNEKKYNGKTLEQWKHKLESSKFIEQIEVGNSIAEIGAPAVPMLMELLKSKDMLLQIRAADILGEIGEPAFETVKKGLSGSNMKVRMGAARALGGIGKGGHSVKECMKLLYSTFKDKDSKVRDAGGSALGKIGKPAYKMAFNGLKSKDQRIQTLCVSALAKMIQLDGPLHESKKFEVTVQALFPLLTAPGKNLQYELDMAFSLLGEKTIPLAAKLLKHSNGERRLQGLRGLRSLYSGAASTDPLIKISLKLLDDTDKGVRQQAQSNLDWHLDDALPSLLKALPKATAMAKLHIIAAMSEISAEQFKSAKGVLESLLKDKNKDVQEAARALIDAEKF